MSLISEYVLRKKKIREVLILCVMDEIRGKLIYWPAKNSYGDFENIGESRINSGTFLFLASYAKKKKFQKIWMIVRSLLRVLGYKKWRVVEKKILYDENIFKKVRSIRFHTYAREKLGTFCKKEKRQVIPCRKIRSGR